jgi:methanogenic corrinoid protein MtbC1
LKGQDGLLELIKSAIELGINPQRILEEALVPAMAKVGQKFSENKVFVPQMLMSARAMGASVLQLKPYFA